jgi:hypothetical protein
MTETQLKNKVLKAIKEKYPQCFAQKIADKFTSGIPDLIGCFNGRFWAVELKVGRNNATPLQLHFLYKIDLAGGRTAICRSVKDVMEFLKTMEAR